MQKRLITRCFIKDKMNLIPLSLVEIRINSTEVYRSELKLI